MSAMTFRINLFLMVIFILQVVVQNVEGVPARTRPLQFAKQTTPMIPTTISRKSTHPTRKSNTRDPRFLGKFSFVAGLNLPHPPTMSPIHRNDIIIKKHVPTKYVTTYNFPPSSWGPFAAAVYEPPPIPSFLEDPLGYLAAMLNPYNWFNNSFTTTNIPTTITTVVPDKNQDEVFLLVHDRDNEIPNEERMNKIESKLGHQDIEKRQYVTKLIPFEVSTTTRDYTTVFNDEQSDIDLIAEETTTQPIEKIRIINNFGENSRQFLFGKKTTTITTEPSTRPTESRPQSIEPHIKTTIPEEETNIPGNITVPTQRPNTTSASNSTIGVTTNSTSQTPYPLNNATYPTHNNGYYYGGRPQNVSHIELTTSKTPQIDKRINSFNDVNQYLQPYQPNYHDFDAPSKHTFETFSRSEQLLPLPNNYYDKASDLTFNNMNDNGLNGFKPSFPLHF